MADAAAQAPPTPPPVIELPAEVPSLGKSPQQANAPEALQQPVQADPQAAPHAAPQVAKAPEAAQAADTALAIAAKDIAAAETALAKPGGLTTAVEQAAAAAQSATLAEQKIGEEIRASPRDVQAQVAEEKSLESLPISAFNVVNLPNNGWNIYSAILVAKESETQNRVIDLDKDINELTQSSLQFAEELITDLDEDDMASIKLIMDNPIPENPTDELLFQKLSELSPEDAAKVEESLKFQYYKDSAVYTSTRDGEKLDTPEKYKRYLDKPLDSNDLSKGPLVSPDIGLLLPKMAKIIGMSIYVYTINKSDPNTYRLMAAAPNESAQIAQLLYKGKNDISVLFPKVRTDAKGQGLVRKAIRGAKQKTTDEIAVEIAQDTPNEVIQKSVLIAKEKVMLVEPAGDFDPESGAYFGGAISFRMKYFPDEDDKVLKAAIHVFNTFFKSDKDLLNPLPPCDHAHIEILLRGLRNRRDTLYDELKKKRARDEDSIQLRTLVGKYKNLQVLISGLEWQEKQGYCENYKADGTAGSFSKIDSEQEAEISKLLRQFAFVVLQAKNPIAEYSDRTTESRNLVDFLREDPLTRDKMDDYIDMWREQAKKGGESMPNILAEVLERTDTQTGLIDSLTKEQLDDLNRSIIGLGRETFTQEDNIAEHSLTAPATAPALTITDTPRPLAITDSPAAPTTVAAAPTTVAAAPTTVAAAPTTVAAAPATAIPKTLAITDAPAAAPVSKGQTGGSQRGGSQRQEFEEIVTKLVEEEQMPRERAFRLVKWIIENTKTQWKNLTNLKAEEKKLSESLTANLREIEDLSSKLKNADAKFLELEGRFVAKSAEASNLQAKGAQADILIKNKEADFNTEKADLALQIANLKQSLETKTTDYDTISAQLSTLNGSFKAGEAKAVESATLVSKLQAQLINLQQQVGQLTQDNQTLQNNYSTAQSQLQQQSSTLEALKASEAAAKASAAAASAKADGLQSQVDSLSANLTESSNKEQAATSQLTGLQSQIEGLNREISTLQSGKTNDANGAAEKEASIARLTAKSKSLDHQVKTLQAEVDASKLSSAKVSRQIKETQGLLSAQQAAVASKEQDRLALKTQLDAKQKEFDALQVRANTTYTQWVQKNNELQTVKTDAVESAKQTELQTKALKGDLEIANQTVHAHLQTIANKDDLLGKLGKTIRDLDAKLVASSKEAAALQKTMLEYQGQLSTLDAAAKEAAAITQAKLDAVNADKQGIAAELERQKLQYETQIRELKTTIASQTDKITALNDQLATITSNLVISQREKETINAQLSAIQRTSNEDIQKLGSALKGKEAEVETNLAALRAQLNEKTSALEESQASLAELNAQFKTHKSIADQVPGLRKQVEEQQAKIDKFPNELKQAAADVIKAEDKLINQSREELKEEFPNMFEGKLQKKGDSIGRWNTRDGAMIATAGRVWYIQFETPGESRSFVISLSEPPKATANHGEFTMHSFVRGRATTYTFREVADGPTRDQWLQKYTELAGSITPVNQDNTIMSELQNLASSIVEKKDYTVSAGLTPQASEAFMQIFTNIKKISGKQAPSLSNQACFLSYFIVFFFKSLFFARTDTGKRQTILAKFDLLADSVITAVRGVFPKETPDKTIIYKVMEVIFGLIDASETLFINKETRGGHPVQPTDTGLSVIKLKDDPMIKPILNAIYEKMSAATFGKDMDFIEKSLLTDMISTPPKIYFNMPPAINVQGDMDQDTIDLLKYPNMTFMPHDQKVADNTATVQVIDVVDGFKRHQFRVNEEWKGDIGKIMSDSTLQYCSLFAAFVVFGRKYLIAAKEDLKATCNIPALLENPATILESMKADQQREPQPQPQPQGHKPEPAAAASHILSEEARLSVVKKSLSKLQAAIKQKKVKISA